MTLLTTTSSVALPQWTAFFNNFPLFLKAFLYTLGVSLAALLLAMVLGVIIGGLSTAKQKGNRVIARVYVEFYQNTPLLVQVVFMYYGLAIISKGFIMPSAFLTTVCCVGLYHAAYIAEVIRSGIEAVPKGQTEAALSQGFTRLQTMSLIIIPQAVRTILPPLTNQVVNLIKNTSIVAIISGADLMFTAKVWAYDTTYYVPAFAGAAFLYFILCFPIAIFGRRQEERNKETYSL
ncbi:amino acid ABC transporter permease [Streptococcus dysgalactiae]|uniref:amino acid ABC transporter permease n=1 Tax=Streptococcus dysgalactiae TaxID=1334 RepID=UPI0001AAB4F7|nr:amino acid ABC transporter permease [Streptococcus dysgalactiae]OBY99256.1 glutamine ABC transporter permease [Streptococcus dysgalactiae subsp. equisimilis]VTS19688.1 L-cystine transport system permease protein tcyB [Streptococcus dysgalactiae subsp. equisimilis]VTS99241.1 L-cystine transport system permease protein tcyB [Streptococcus dysgalactiae subsp. equisimilis]BAH81068.1 hypothetical protein SDEG_0566 [Streptococcus dysgalactiae subsp. equisimilis GGS_124]GET70491.1 glutamine ABC tr